MYSRLEVAACAKRINRSVPTIWRWIRAGCRIDDPVSLEAFRIQMERKKTNIAKARERRGKEQKSSAASQSAGAGIHTAPPGTFEADGNGETLPPPGRRGAAAALQRLEEQEERAHARLQLALEGGDPLQIDAAQTYWLRVAETLRRLDAGLELGRRSLEEQVPKKLACDVVLAVSDWCRISFMLFLSSEGKALMGIRDFGEWKLYAAQRFVGILHMTLRSSLSTQSPVPPWAAEKVKESWNVAVNVQQP